ncbi:putative Restriction modification system protein [Thiomonas arsenitoxydans]|nr:putative Restriction modification system protein [Thiomonas arsenitoxydans]CQR30332.1 putative Restriction modification system protein [Thiomonas arsenitoxydans]CQR30362.1 putative Restriction modification system protein [Thiomonas arsenitoxydans]CQR32243.1 putative Restriction modification system protein [Thiomonas arsenitoxydans]
MGSAGPNGTHDVARATGPGVVIGRSGASIGRVHFSSSDYWPHNTCLYVTDFCGNNPRFAYYLLSTLDLAKYNSGSAQPSLNRNFIYSMPVEIPGRREQDEIVEVLQTIDDRIDLLRQTNATLEAIAQALFKSWFVDFDPVRAKAEGREPEGMDAETAALFPSEFEESELGAIPKGWRVGALDSFATYLNGLALQKYPPESAEEYLPVIKIAQLRAGHTNSADKASAQLKPEYIVRDGDVLFSWSGSLEVELWCGGVGALNQHLFKVTSCKVPKWFYYLATKHFLPGFRDIAAHKATTMGHIQRRHLAEARLAMPALAVLDELSPLMGPLLDRRVNGGLQARELVAIRDSLLPRLISGKLPVKEARDQIDEALQ